MDEAALVRAQSPALTPPLRIDRHAARGRLLRPPSGRGGRSSRRWTRAAYEIGEGTLLEPGCWLTLAPDATIEIGEGSFLNRGTMIAAYRSVMRSATT